MACKIKIPTTAISKLLYDYNTNGNELVSMGYFKNVSTIYGSSYKDVRKLNIGVIFSLSEALYLTSGNVLDKLINLQKEYPPKKPIRLRS